MNYFDWLNSLIEVVIDRIENRLGKKFSYDLELAFEAAKHSDALYKRDDCFHAPLVFLNKAQAEVIGVSHTYYNDEGIKKGLEEIADVFLGSCGHRELLHDFNNLGAGIAIGGIGREKIKIYFTIRLN